MTPPEFSSENKAGNGLKLRLFENKVALGRAAAGSRQMISHGAADT